MRVISLTFSCHPTGGKYLNQTGKRSLTAKLERARELAMISQKLCNGISRDFQARAQAQRPGAQPRNNWHHVEGYQIQDRCQL